MPPNITYKNAKTKAAQWHHATPNDFTWSQCASCAHYKAPRTSADTPICAAFPGGVPKNVMHNLVDHQFDVSGDHGIRWERRAGSVIPNPFAEPE